jgi:hypothetical protein
MRGRTGWERWLTGFLLGLSQLRQVGFIRLWIVGNLQPAPGKFLEVGRSNRGGRSLGQPSTVLGVSSALLGVTGHGTYSNTHAKGCAKKKPRTRRIGVGLLPVPLGGTCGGRGLVPATAP